MMSDRIEAEQLDIHNMADPRQWMPVRGVKRGQRPLETSSVEAGCDGGVVSHIFLVIVRLDKLAADDVPIGARCHNDEQETDNSLKPEV